MKIVKVEPRDFYITIEFGLKEAGKILDALDNSTIIGVKDKGLEDAAEQLTMFHRMLDEVTEAIHKEAGTDGS